MREINEIIVHCAATKPSMNIGAATIRKWHVEERGWRDIGYNYVIRRNGNIEQGRPDDQSGAHARGHNKHSIGICLVGGMSKDGDTTVSNFTEAQWAALPVLVGGLKAQHPGAAVIGHNDVTTSKTCPNFDVKAWWKEQ